MGNHRFRLSEMIPNAWFHKLKDMGRTKNHHTNRHPRKKKHPPTTSSSSPSSSTETAFPAAQQPKTNQPRSHALSHQRKSYYFTRELTPPSPPKPPITNPKGTDTHFPDSPRKSSKKLNRAFGTRPSTKQLVTSSVSTGCRCGATVESLWAKPDSTSEEYPNSPLFSSSEPESLLPEFGSDHDHEPGFSSGCCRVDDDILINKNDKKSLNAKFEGFATISELELPLIITKKSAKCRVGVPEDQKKKIDSSDSAKFEQRNTNGSLSVKVVKEDKVTTSREQRTSLVRRVPASSPRVRLRTISPRIASRKIQAVGRKSVSSYRKGRHLSQSFAMVKSSSDPQKDFRESMVEMIMENDIRASKDLEDLLACYLQLNSDEYHGLIIKVFKQIWFDYAHVRLK